MEYKDLSGCSINESISIYNCDCMDLLKQTPDNYYSLAIVDPPYGIGIAKTGQIGTGKKFTPKNWDSGIPNQIFFNELKRVSKKQIVWGVNYFDGLGLNGGRIIWNKLGKDVGRRKVAPTFSECEIAYYSGANNVKMFSYTYIGNVQGNDYQILWSDTGRIHPTQKPVELYEWLLANYAEPNQKILDTHLGSGSIAIAIDNVNKIEKMNLTLTACELDTDYFNAAMKRIEQQTAQQTIF